MTLWTVAHQTPLSMQSLQARILEWVAMLSSRILEVESESHSVVSDSVIPWNSPGQNTGLGKLFPSPGDLPNLGIKPSSPTFQPDSLPYEPLGKPKNTGVGSLSLLQWIFPTQELNSSLLHCRWILYQLSY